LKQDARRRPPQCEVAFRSQSAAASFKRAKGKLQH
jgi:hypothetical protein